MTFYTYNVIYKNVHLLVAILIDKQSSKGSGSFMRKLTGWRDLVAGGVYNMVYVGPAGKRGIDEKQTFVVIKNDPKLVVQFVFDQFGSIYSDQLRSDERTLGLPDKVFEHFDLFEPTDESEWFRSAIKVTSLAEALEAGLVTTEYISNQEISSHCFQFAKDLGVYWLISLDETFSGNPLLRRVFILWKSWDALDADFAQYKTTINHS